jgi:hypothetical protein
MGKTDDLLKKIEEQRKSKYSQALEKGAAVGKPPQEPSADKPAEQQKAQEPIKQPEEKKPEPKVFDKQVINVYQVPHGQAPQGQALSKANPKKKEPIQQEKKKMDPHLKISIVSLVLLVIVLLVNAGLFFLLKTSTANKAEVGIMEKTINNNRDMIKLVSDEVKKIDSDITAVKIKVKENAETVSHLGSGNEKIEEIGRENDAFEMQIDSLRKAKDQLFKRVSELEAKQ